MGHGERVLAERRVKAVNASLNVNVVCSGYLFEGSSWLLYDAMKNDDPWESVFIDALLISYLSRLPKDYYYRITCDPLKRALNFVKLFFSP